jgi:hypothetical protein
MSHGCAAEKALAGSFPEGAEAQHALWRFTRRSSRRSSTVVQAVPRALELRAGGETEIPHFVPG